MSSFVTRWLKISLVVIVGCGFLSMMIYALMNRDEISSSQIEPPLITPSAEPLKRRPDQPGGMQIPNRDKMVFDLLDSSSSTLDVTNGVAIDDDVPDDVSAVAPQPVMAVSETLLETVIAPVVKPVEQAAPALAPAKPIETVVTQPKVEEKKVAEPVKAKDEPVKKPEPAKTATKPAAGKWGVQLAAVNSTADGNVFAAKASKDFAALSGLTAKISPVPGGGKYRVQFVGLASRDAAAEVCNKLKGKQGCFPVSIQ
ncbi:MAG: SPOR domain-containing protein [Sphingobacteriales bacterium]|nr:MAG: SPOR domain-containing protein [Sphingobacteriales bacterium]